METTQQQARQIIRHLKRGAFPPSGIEHCTVGSEREARQLAKALTEAEAGASRHLFLEASPGWGKSHLLSLADAFAIRSGFAVSWVTIDSYAHAFNHPTRYLHSLLENLRVPAVGTRGLANLFSHWLRNDEKDALIKWANSRAPWDMRWALNRMIAAQADPDGTVPDWYYDRLEGRDLQFRNGRAYYPVFYERVAALISLVRAIGLKGIVFLFDELESIATLPQLRSRMLSYEVLNTLTDARKFPCSFFIFAATLDFGSRLQEDAAYSAVYENEYPDGYRFVTKWRAHEPTVISLKPIHSTENRRLLGTLRTIHETAYAGNIPTQLPDAFIDRFLQEAVRGGLTQREIIKSFVSLAEICQQHPSCNPAEQLFGESFATQSNSFELHDTPVQEPPVQPSAATPGDPSSKEQTTGREAAPSDAWSRLVSELQEYAFGDSVSLSLDEFLAARSVNLTDLYGDHESRSWTRLLRDAGFVSGAPEPDENYFARLFKALLSVNDAGLLSLVAATARSGRECQDIPEAQHRQLERLSSSIESTDTDGQPQKCLCKRFPANPHSREELAELAALLAKRVAATTATIEPATPPPQCAPRNMFNS